jgi:hypothetical protein
MSFKGGSANVRLYCFRSGFVEFMMSVALSGAAMYNQFLLQHDKTENRFNRMSSGTRTAQHR